MELTFQTVLILIFIGVFAGILSGFVGVGGGIVIVPALIYFMGFTQLQAQGTSLAVLLLPVGILAVMNYYKAGNVNFQYAMIIGATFIVGGYIGAKLAHKLSEDIVKFIFGLLMLYVAIRFIWVSGVKLFH